MSLGFSVCLFCGVNVLRKDDLSASEFNLAYKPGGKRTHLFNSRSMAIFNEREIRDGEREGEGEGERDTGGGGERERERAGKQEKQREETE